MDFAHSPLAHALRQRLEAFMQRYLLPYNAAWHASVQAGVFPPPIFG
jgi:acyl-CoA dehydrogenase